MQAAEVVAGLARRRAEGMIGTRAAKVVTVAAGLFAAFAMADASVKPGGILHPFAQRLADGAIRKVQQLRAADPALPDVQFGVYGGGSLAHPSQITLKQPGDTDMSLEGVAWDSGAGKMPPYHGFRAIWWSRNLPAAGSMVDLAYIKVIADRDAPVSQSGTRDGAKVPAKEAPSKTFRRLEFTNGLNLLTWNAIVRLPAFLGRVRPYFGVGAGLSVPHVEVRRQGASKRTFEFQVAGLAFHVFAGLEWRVRDRFSVFGEYKLSYAGIDADLVDGGTLGTDIWINQFVAGASGHVRRPLVTPAAQ